MTSCQGDMKGGWPPASAGGHPPFISILKFKISDANVGRDSAESKISLLF